MSTKLHPIPSHVCVKSFVTVNLSDKCMYSLWKTQMLHLLESHGMLCFINDDHVMQQQVGGDDDDDDEHNKLWNRSDVLVRGWILASISEQAAIAVLSRLESKLHGQFTAKHIWDQVESMYGQHEPERQKERRGRERGGSSSPCEDLMKKVKETRERSRNKEDLYDAVECGRLQQVMDILKTEKVGITESISINGNTVLHIAVACKGHSSDGFLKSMLDLSDHYNISLKDVRNSDGSTLLHLAVSHGNINAAKILLDRSPDLLQAKDNQGCTPRDITLSQSWNKEMCLFLIEYSTMLDIEQADVEPPLVNAISYKHFDSALAFLQRCKSLNRPAEVLMAIAQNCPADFTPIQLIIHELLRTPLLHFITRRSSHLKGCKKLASLVLGAVFAYTYKVLIRICMKLQLLKHLQKTMKRREDARDLLDAVCALIKLSNEARCDPDFYKEAMLEAIRRDASDVVEIIVYWFPEAALIADEDGHNFAQAAWKNRSSKVYALILDGNLAKHTNLSQESKEDNHCGNNFLHFAARLGPSKKLDHVLSPPTRLQRELLWFKLALEKIPQGRMSKNCLGETPEMVFRKEHKNLESESAGWIKGVANSVAITSILIITVMFAAVIQVPGGSGDNGLPNFVSHPAFSVFEILITISATAASLSLLLFLEMLTLPLTQDDYLLRLPLAIAISRLSLFVSEFLSGLAFWAALFLLFGTKHPWVLIVITSLIVLPFSCFFLVYSWFMSKAVNDFMHSTDHFFIILGFRRLKLVGQIFI